MFKRRALLLLPLLILGGLFLAVRLHQEITPWWRHLFVDSTWALFSLGAAVACAIAARRLPAGSLRRAWWLFSGGSAVWFCGILVWSWIELVQGRLNPFPSLADPFFLAMPLCFMAAMAFLRRERRTLPLSLLQVSSVGLVLIGASIAITLALAGAPPGQGGSLTLIVVGANVVLFSADFLFGLSCLLTAAHASQRRTLVPIVVGQGFNLWVVIAYERAVLDASYEVGGWLDIAFCVLFGLVMLAAQEQACAALEGPDVTPEQPTLARLDSFFPALALGGCLLASLPYLENVALAPPWLLAGEGLLFVCAVSLHNLASREILGDLEASLESARARAQEAQGLESMGTLASSLAHDFNNILTIIRGHLFLMRNGVSDLDSVEEAIAQGSDLTRSLQSLARKQAGERRPRNLKPLIVSASHLIRSVLPGRITIHLEIEEELPLVLVYPSLLQRALVNLGLNARDAMPEGGLLTLGARVVAGSARLEVFVADTGLGMPPEVAARAFEPYFTTKAEGAGTGLGLAMVAEAARAHEGEVRAEPLAQGTRIVITIPLALPQEEPTGPAPERGADSPSRRGRVLVVDDDPGVRGVVQTFLTRQGWQVSLAADGAEAFEVVERVEREEPFELVITDLGMPRMGGLELAAKLRARGPELPIVLMSGDSALDRPEAQAFPHRLRKPLDLDGLLACVEAATAEARG